MRWFKFFVAIVSFLLIVYLLGPHPLTPVYNLSLPSAATNEVALEEQVAAIESAHHLKKDNQARIVWNNDSSKSKTEYAIVYLHGFSASQEEGNPVHRNVAKKLGDNLYLARLAEHGIDTTDALVNLTADNYWESAKQALAVGKQLGNKVILMGTSTGGTLALKLAASYPKDVAALILFSPNIAIKDPNAWLLNNPWGLQIARLVKRSSFINTGHTEPLYKQYWNAAYRLEATVALEELLETTMLNNTFTAIHQPTLVLYYYKDEQHQDNVVKVAAIKDMFNKLGTDSTNKRMIAVPNAGNHVLASPIQSNDIITPERETIQFLKTVLHLP